MLEPLGRFHETDVSFLDEVKQGEPLMHSTARQGSRQPKVVKDERLSRLPTLVTKPIQMMG